MNQVIKNIEREIAKAQHQHSLHCDLHGKHSRKARYWRVAICSAKSRLHAAKCERIGRDNVIGAVA